MMEKRFCLKTAFLLVLIIGIAGINPVGAQGVPADTLRITLQDALEIAFSDNLTIKVADLEVQRQQYVEKGAYAALFPQVDLSGSYQRTIEKQTMYMDGVPGMESGIKVGRENYWTGGATVSLPLISVPLWKSLKISAHDVELSIEKARSSRIDMRDQVQRAFYAVLLAEDARDVFKEAYDNALKNYEDIKNRFDQGTVAEYDLIRADVNLKNAEPNLYDAENSIILTRWQLKALLGIDLAWNITCIGSLTDYESTLIAEYLQTDFSLGNNSDLRQIDIQVKQLEQVRRMQIAKYYPSLNTQFGYQWIAMNNNFKIGHYRWDPYSTVGLSLTIPVFAGGARKNEIRQTQVQQQQLNLQRLDAERQLRVAIRQSADQMNTCVKQYQAASAGIKQAETGYMITMKRYETGQGTILEINDSQLQLTQARLNLNQAIYNYLVSKSALEKTLGGTTDY